MAVRTRPRLIQAAKGVPDAADEGDPDMCRPAADLARHPPVYVPWSHTPGASGGFQQRRMPSAWPRFSIREYARRISAVAEIPQAVRMRVVGGLLEVSGPGQTVRPRTVREW